MMNTREEFYVHVHGEQLGPYTVRHLDHLLHSGLIPVDTLFWREGLEQWAPITTLVPLRRRRRPWMRLVAAAIVLVPVLTFLVCFAPAVADGWREQSQREFSEVAAYWAGRGVWREQSRSMGWIPSFLEYRDGQVQLAPGQMARVDLQGEWLAPKPGEFTATLWLTFDPELRVWTPAPSPTAAR
jgi:ferric-dicitrate binding protein FerR (iron transport regulator)